MKYTMPHIALLSLSAIAITACAGAKIEQKYPTSANRETGDGTNNIYEKTDGIFGKDGIFSSKGKDSDDTGGNIGVNTYLWRASLDTVSFMPIASADPFGGTIITDWYENPDSPGERFKLNVLILDRELSANGVRVRVFKQTGYGKTWKDAAAPASMARDLESAIITRARQMRTKKLGPLG